MERKPKKRTISSFFTPSDTTKPPKRAKESTTDLECPKCTFLNSTSSSRCQMCRSPLPTATVGHTTSVPPGPNAFSFLMAKAAEKPRRESFVLTKHRDGSLTWNWATVPPDMTSKEFHNLGGPDTKWSAVCALKDRSLNKPGVILLSTNIPSCDDTPLRKDRSHWFSPSHLKSALQKNIRR